ALNAGKCRFEACRGYALVAQLVEAAASRAACCRFESCAAHQFHAPFAKRQRHLAYTQTFGGSSPSGSTNQTQRCKRVREARAAADNRAWQAEGVTSRLHQLRTRSLKPEWRGSGLLTRRHVDRNHSRPPRTSYRCAERGGLLLS